MSPQVRGRVEVRPLWLRIEGNRLRLAVFVTMFVAGSVLVAEIVLLASLYGLGIVLLFISARYSGADEGAPVYVIAGLLRRPAPAAWWIAGIGAVVACLYVAYALGRPLRGRLVALGARFAPLGEMLDTKHALKEMSLAAGFDPAPELFVLDSSSVNALCLARGKARPFVVVTRGLVERFSRDEQKAVFAHLLARLRSGDVHWATAVSALMAPIWKWREASLGTEDRDVPVVLLADEPPGAFAGGDSRHRVRWDDATAPLEGASEVWMLVAWAWVTYVMAIIASEIVLLGHHRSHLAGAITADAEGMLLLKDPVLMLRTLRRAIEADNRVRLALPMYAGLFYIWAGDDLTDEDDPDWQRVERLREVVGVDGISDADAESEEAIDASMARGFLVAPEAPRLADADAAASAGYDVLMRPVEPWSDEPVPPLVLWTAVMACSAVGWSALWLLVGGSQEVTRGLLIWTPVAAGLAGAVVGRWWAPVFFIVGGALLVGASGMALGSSPPSPLHGALALAAALLAGGAGALLNRAIFGSVGRKGG